MERTNDNAVNSTEYIAYAIEDSFIEYLRVVSANGNKPFLLNDKIGWVRTFPTAWSNFIFYANFDYNQIDREIASICSKINKGELPDVWLVGPKSYPRDLGDYLVKHNIKKQYSMSGMAIDLTKLKTASMPENLHIKSAATKSDLELWAAIVSKALWNGEPFEAHLFENLLDIPDYKFYLGFLNDKAVASSMLMLTNGVAEINMVSTLQEYKRKGIGTAMTEFPLIYAKDRGYKVGVLQASNPGEPIYRKIGFEEYFRFDVYKYIRTVD